MYDGKGIRATNTLFSTQYNTKARKDARSGRVEAALRYSVPNYRVMPYPVLQ